MPTSAQDPLPLWDIYQEHLDEAAFLSSQWERSLLAPDRTLETVAEGPEERWLAHLDALVCGGPLVAERLLLPALAQEDLGRVVSSALALIATDGPKGIDAVFQRLASAPAAAQAAIGRALMLAPQVEVGPRSAHLLHGASPAAQAILLEVLAFRRVDPGMFLDPLFSRSSGPLRCAILKVARVFPDRLAPNAVEWALGSPDPAERSAALETAAVLGTRSAWTACERILSSFGAGWGDAALLWALSGDPELGLLLAGLEDPAHLREAAWALGFTGRPAAADALLGLIGDAEVGRLCAESFRAITGLPLGSPFFGPPPAIDDGPLDEPVLPSPEDALPFPNAGAIEEWWIEQRPQVDPECRLLAGAAWGLEPLRLALSDGSMRRRGPLAVELAIRTRGLGCVTTSAFTFRQREELAAARDGDSHFAAEPLRAERSGGSPVEHRPADLPRRL